MKTLHLLILTLLTMLTGCYHTDLVKFEKKYGYKLDRVPTKDTCMFLGTVYNVNQEVKITVTDSLKFYSNKTLPYYVNMDTDCNPYAVKIK